MKQTAVEWLVSELNQKIDFIPIDKWDMIRDIVQQAKQMEKEQIINANIAGVDVVIEKKRFIIGEQYYNETYGSKGNDERIVDTNKTITSQTEISDEEIEKAGIELSKQGVDLDYKWIMGAKWYREQLKSK